MEFDYEGVRRETNLDMDFQDHIQDPSADKVLDNFDLMPYNYLLSEEDEYDVLCNFLKGSAGMDDKLKDKIGFIEDISEKLDIRPKVLLERFKDKDTFRFFHRTGWSLKNLSDIFERGYKLKRELLVPIDEYLSKNRNNGWTDDDIEDLSRYIQNYGTRKIENFDTASIIASIWFGTKKVNKKFLLESLGGKVSLSDMLKNRKILMSLIQESVIAGTYPDTGGICSDDDNPPGNILIGTVMKWKWRPAIGGVKLKVYEPVDDFKYEFFRNAIGQDKRVDYSASLDREPLTGMYGGRLFKYMTKKKEKRSAEYAFFDIKHSEKEWEHHEREEEE